MQIQTGNKYKGLSLFLKKDVLLLTVPVAIMLQNQPRTKNMHVLYMYGFIDGPNQCVWVKNCFPDRG